MTRIQIDGDARYHTLASANSKTLRFDCELELAYQRVHVTTADVPPELRCEGCETVRLRAVEFFTDQAVRELEDA